MADYDKTVGWVQEYLESVIHEFCENLCYPVPRLVFGIIPGADGGTNVHSRGGFVYIRRDLSLEQQLKTLFHEFAHLEIEYGTFGEDILEVQRWWDTTGQRFYRAFHATWLCAHERFADSYGETLGNMTPDYESCSRTLLFLKRWESEPELIFQSYPNLRLVPEFVQLFDEWVQEIKK